MKPYCQRISELIRKRFEGETETVRDLCELKILLEKAGIHFWLQSGTLLGCMAFGHIIPGDRDIDLGMWSRDRCKFIAIIPQLRALGFRVIENYDPGRETLQGLVSVKRDGLLIHFKMYEEVNGYAVMGIARNTNLPTKILRNFIHILYFGEIPEHLLQLCDNCNNNILAGLIQIFQKVFRIVFRQNLCQPTRRALIAVFSKLWRKWGGLYGIVAIPAHHFSEFRHAEFYGMKFLVPANSESYLREEYGDDWKRFDPSGKGGLEKISHIVVSPSNCTNYNMNEERQRRLKAVAYQVTPGARLVLRSKKDDE